MKRVHKIVLNILSCSIIASGLTACLSMQSQTTLDAIQASMSAQPFTEAYIEYPGPSEKWSGPTSFIMHVTAKDSGTAQVYVSPALFNKPGSKEIEAPTAPGRTLAAVVPHGITGDAARDQLSHLATALQGADESFRGCLSPVRVRMIRADGSLLEKKGCRGQNGWSKAASESVNYFISASLK